MADPYGIEPINLPGIVGAVQAYQGNRVQQMVTRQQLAALERQAERDAGLDQVIARVSGQQGRPAGATGAYSAPQQSAAPAQAPATPPTAAPQAGVPQLSQEDELALRMGGERGVQIATAIRGMNDQQREMTNRRAMTGGQIAQQLQAITDPQQRRAELLRAAPILIGQGFTQQEIEGYAADLSDASLDAHIRDARLVSTLARGGEGFTLGEGQVRYDAQGNQVAAGPPQRRRWFPVQPGGTIMPEPEGPAPAARPPSVAPGTTESYNGRQYRLSPQGQWEDIGPAVGATQAGSSDLDNWNNAGRAGPQGPRTFR